MSYCKIAQITPARYNLGTKTAQTTKTRYNLGSEEVKV